MSAPYPDIELATRVCSLASERDPYEAYEQLGAEAKAALVELLPDDFSFSGKRVLDFGCGAGRTLRHFLTEARDAEFWGADIDGPSIEWLQGNLSPPLSALRNEADPPLPVERRSFDLIWALSVFTHLTRNSLPWLLELHSVLKPGGLLVATYMGRWNSGYYLSEPWDEDKVGMNILRPDLEWDEGGPVVFMSDWWVREHWGRAFELVDVAPRVQGQTWALLRKREVELTVDDLERPGDDPREWAALRHNARQAERHAEDRLNAYYADSLSWRITSPLRAARRLVSRSPRR